MGWKTFKWNSKMLFKCPHCKVVCRQVNVHLIYYAQCKYCHRRYMVDFEKSIWMEINK